MNESEHEEGARSFLTFLRSVGYGHCETELNDRLHELVSVMQTEASAQSKVVGGKLTLDLSFAMSEMGQVAIEYSIKVKHPTPKRPGSTMFVTRGGNLQRNDPRQMDMDLRPVPTGREDDDEVRDIR